MRVQGLAIDNHIVIPAGGDQFTPVLPPQVSTTGATTPQVAATPQRPPTVGELKMAVILVNFQDQAQPEPWLSPSDVHRFVFQDVNQFIQESSYGKAWLSGQVVGYYTLDMTTAEAKVNADIMLEKAVARADADLYWPDYPYVVVFSFFGTVSPRFGGRAWGDQKYSTSDGEITLYVAEVAIPHPDTQHRELGIWGTVAHELIHNFGVHHANGLDCGTEILRANGCPGGYIEYGDPFDIMGTGGGGIQITSSSTCLDGSRSPRCRQHV